MAKYTVQLRFVVEQLIRDAGGSGIDPSQWHLAYPRLGLASTGNGMGLPPYPVPDEGTRDRINAKIVQRYWFNEIGQETVGQFAWFLNETMNRIMPYYNALYESKLSSAKDIVGEHWGIDRLTKLASTSEGTSSGATSSTANGVGRVLDTPESRIENLDDGWLTSASKTEDTGNATSDSSTTGKRDDTGSFGETGLRIGPVHWQLALSVGRELLNIDRMIVDSDEVRECFMLIW